jgi:hypothetical protein
MKDIFQIATTLKAPAPSVRIRFGEIVSVESDRTVTVTIGGSTDSVSGVPYLEGVAPKPGAKAILLTDGVDLMVLDHIAAPGMTITPRAYRTSDLTVANATDTVVSWQAVNTDDWGCWSAGNASRLTAPITGRYQAVAQLQFAGNTTGVRSAWIEHSVDGTIARTQLVPASTPLYFQVVTAAFGMTKGDYITLTVRQNSGGNLVLNQPNTFDPSLTLIYLG